MALLRSFVWVGRLARCTGTVVRSASGGGGEGERVKGANYFNEGEDPVLKADTEYPEWLWELKTAAPKLSDLSVEQREYWQRAAKLKLRQNNQEELERRGG